MVSAGRIKQHLNFAEAATGGLFFVWMTDISRERLFDGAGMIAVRRTAKRRRGPQNRTGKCRFRSVI
jgi:hypothetical protein